jgi:hypothetical protein
MGSNPTLRFAEKVVIVLTILFVIGAAIFGLTALFTTTSTRSSGPPPAPLTANPR